MTSRNRMAGLVARDGAARLALDSLSMAGSLELLRGVLGTGVVDAEIEAATELAERCGHLPLALRIAAEHIAGGGYIALSEMVAELRVEQNRLDTLSTPDDPLSSVRAVFSSGRRRRRAVDRWYLTVTVAARSILMPDFATQEQQEAGEGRSTRFPTYDDAIRWANDELSTVEAVVRLAIERGHLRLATRIASTISVLFHCTSRWKEWLRLAELGLAAVTRIGDDRRRGFLYADAAQAAHQLGHEDETMRYIASALALLESLPDPTDSAVVDNLAVAYATMAVYTNSISQMADNWDIVERHGSKAAVGTMSMSFCLVLSRAGRHEEAMRYGRRGVAAFREMMSSYILGQALLFLGDACARARELAQADRHYGEALELWRRHGDRQRTAQTMHAVARTRHQTGRDKGVRALLREAPATIDECAHTKANEQERELILVLLDELPG